MPADAVDYGYYRYTDAFGNHWSVKTDITWGDNAESGLATANTDDPVMVTSRSLRPRKIFLQDLTSGRVTSRVVGTYTADAWAISGYTTTVKFRGLATGVVMTKFDQRDEHIRKARTITHKPEPT